MGASKVEGWRLTRVVTGVGMAMLALFGMASGSARAQGWQDGAVQVYGILDTAVRHVNEANAGKALTQFASGLNTSRVGFKGSEFIGAVANNADVHAIFRLESGFNPGTGSSANSAALFDRSAYAGLAGEAWDLRAGRQEGFGYELAASGVTDPLSAALNLVDYAAPAAASGQGAVLGANPLQAVYSYTYGQLRYNNALKLNLGQTAAEGWQGGFLYSLSPTAGSAIDNTVRALSLSDIIGVFRGQALVQQAIDGAGHRSTLGVLAGVATFADWRFQAAIHELHVTAGFNASGLGNGASSNGILGNTATAPAALAATNQEFHFAVGDLGLTWHPNGATPVTLAAYRSAVSGNASASSAGVGHATSVVLLGKWHLSKRTTLFADLDGARSSGTLAQATVSRHPGELGYTIGLNHRF